MPLTQTYQLGSDGKVVAGLTVLRDETLPRGWVRDVEQVWSGRMPLPDHPYFRGSTAERCALHGRPAKEYPKRTSHGVRARLADHPWAPDEPHGPLVVSWRPRE